MAERKTAAEVEADLRKRGWTGPISNAKLKQSGWTPLDPFGGLVIENAQTDQEVKDQLSRLQEEGRKNNVPAAILEGFTKLVGFAMKAV